MNHLPVQEIATVEYKQDSKRKGKGKSFITYIDNLITFKDSTKAVRLGIQNVNGKTIKEMASSLIVATEEPSPKPHWFSLQTTSLPELKAAFQAGFRHRGFSNSLDEHIKAFQGHCGTLHVEKWS